MLRQVWMRTYVSKRSDTKNTSEESTVLLPKDHADKIREAVSIVDAGECIEYVITLGRKLEVRLDQYRF